MAIISRFLPIGVSRDNVLPKSRVGLPSNQLLLQKAVESSCLTPLPTLKEIAWEKSAELRQQKKYTCGHFFRKLYVCMIEDDSQDATVRCPEEFIDWAACMQNMSDERRMQMRTHLLEPGKEKAP